MTAATHLKVRGRHRAQHRHLRRPGRPSNLERIMSLILIAGALGVLGIGYGVMDNRWYKVLTVEGGSMEPAISPGDLMVITAPQPLEPGDIAIFQVNGRLVTHRVLAVGADGAYVTQGDANPAPDRWAPGSAEVVGLHRFTIPLLGHLLSAGTGAWFADSDQLGVSVSALPTG